MEATVQWPLLKTDSFLIDVEQETTKVYCHSYRILARIYTATRAKQCGLFHLEEINFYYLPTKCLQLVASILIGKY